MTINIYPVSSCMPLLNSSHNDEQAVSETCPISQSHNKAMFDLHIEGRTAIWGCEDQHSNMDFAEIHNRGHITVWDGSEHGVHNPYKKIEERDNSDNFNYELHMQGYFNLYGALPNYNVGKPVNYVSTPLQIKQRIKNKNKYKDSMLQRFMKLLKSLCACVIRYSNDDTDELLDHVVSERRTLRNFSYANDSQRQLGFYNRYKYGGMDQIMKPFRYIEKYKLKPKNVGYTEFEESPLYYGLGYNTNCVVM